ncbi:hypothetical protein SRRS_01530 [Sporomusa rhizae]|uniref:hypothetical protein n=1 Tax=Sporomusa rhizae TaxID=357999 RepID=UPI00352A9C57
MVTLYIADEKIECAEVKPIKLTMLITGNGEEYLLVHDWGRQHLFAVQRGKGEQPEFVYIDKVIRVEEETQYRRIAK